MPVYRPAGPLVVALGPRRIDVTNRALVMGILNRTKDSFFGPAATYDLDAFFRRAEQLVNERADLLDVGGVKAGPGDEVTEEEELDRVCPRHWQTCEAFRHSSQHRYVARVGSGSVF